MLRDLRDKGFVAIAGADGYPLVLRKHVEDIMSGAPTTKKKPQPDFEGLLRRLNRGKK
jgi:hypothetical protein